MAKSTRKHNAPWTSADLKKLRALAKGKKSARLAAMELERYGVTANAIAPGALTRMTEGLGMGQLDEESKAAFSPRWIAPIVTWLASTESGGCTGRVFQVSGRELAIAEGWHRGPSTEPTDDPTEIGALKKIFGRDGASQAAPTL